MSWLWLYRWLFGEDAKKPKMVLHPPLFDRSTHDETHRLLRSPLDNMSAHRKSVLNAYFHAQRRFCGSLRMTPEQDSHVDMVADVWKPGTGADVTGEARVRLRQAPGSSVNPSFAELLVNPRRSKLRGALFYPTSSQAAVAHGLCGFGELTHPLFSAPNDRVGVRYSTDNVAVGAFVGPSKGNEHVQHGGWVMGRLQDYNLTGGVQWSSKMQASTLDKVHLALFYSQATADLSKPAYEIGVELRPGQQLAFSYYHHLVTQRRVYNPLEEDAVVGITNYIDIGLELVQSQSQGAVEGDTPGYQEPELVVGGQWQINKNHLLKARLGYGKASVAWAAKSWWSPAGTVALSYHYDMLRQTSNVGLSLHLENLGGVSYERPKGSYNRRVPYQVEPVSVASFQ